MTSAYTPEQIAEYLDCVQLPPEWHPSASPTLDLNYLTILHTHQISTIPYENLSLHYSVTKDVPLDPQHLFEKFIHRKRGGYCMETSIFYNHILRALGFKVYTAGVRIRLREDGRPIGKFVGWHHVVNIVTLPSPSDSTKSIDYMVDVGFGGDGATRPLPLIHGYEQQNLGSQYIRLIYSTIPEQVDQTKKLWIYQYRNASNKEWNSYYAFPEAEFTESDLSILNFWVYSSPESFQRHLMLIIKFLRTEDKITGKLMLVHDVVKQNLGGKTEVVQVLKNERERIEVLKSRFGLVFTEEEMNGIKGWRTELKG